MITNLFIFLGNLGFYEPDYLRVGGLFRDNQALLMKFNFFWDNRDFKVSITFIVFNFLPITDLLSVITDYSFGVNADYLFLLVEYPQYSEVFSRRFILLWILFFWRPLPKAMS